MCVQGVGEEEMGERKVPKMRLNKAEYEHYFIFCFCICFVFVVLN